MSLCVINIFKSCNVTVDCTDTFILIKTFHKLFNKKSVAKFWETGVLNGDSNVQFGEGGAGTFSDGKLSSQIKDKANRIDYVLETFVKFGANQTILFDNKPHIGTDILASVIINMRKDTKSPSYRYKKRKLFTKPPFSVFNRY